MKASQDGALPPPQLHDWTPSTTTEPHEQTEEIVRQVEFYFSDENLPQDAHLLARTGECGDGWVSLNEILSFRKMRSYKPPARVKASLAQSTKLEIWNNKMIRRRDPLTVPLKVVPKVNPARETNKKLADQPWMTKGMLKPTGFEEYATEGPLKPEEYEEEQKLFDPEETFLIRIEHAVTRYQSRRKMHQQTLKIFTKFLMYGGFDAGQRMFAGGLTKSDLEGFSKDEIAEMQAKFAVSEAVMDGLGPDMNGGSWIVDFEGIAKSFISSEFMATFDWKDAKMVSEATNILRNFYNYLLYHDVCPEYHDQVLKACEACDLADQELPKLAKVDTALPGQFNIAASTLHKGSYKALRSRDPSTDWMPDDGNIGLSDKDAMAIFMAGISAHCTEEQIHTVSNARIAIAASTAEDAANNKTGLQTVAKEDIGLEIVGVEHATDRARGLYDSDAIKETVIRPLGKLHCVRWNVPHAPPRDLAQADIAAQADKTNQKYEFLLEEDTLQHCLPGMKFQAVIHELEIGITWIDSLEYVYPSFYTWTWNERIRDWKEPGPPKAWQERQNPERADVDQELALMANNNEADDLPD